MSVTCITGMEDGETYPTPVVDRVGEMRLANAVVARAGRRAVEVDHACAGQLDGYT